LAEVIPDPEKIVAVVDVPVILLPEYHCELLPEAPVKAIWNVKYLWMMMLPLSRDTGMSTVPPVLTAVVTEIVIVGCVASVSTEVVTPLGAMILLLSTAAGIWLAPHIATTVVVVLPALAAEVLPGKVKESFVRMTEKPSVKSTILIWSELLIAIFVSLL
jgi:hypothetical protein